MRATGALALLVGLPLLTVVATGAHAVERIRARIDSVTVGEIVAHEVRAELAIPSSRHSRLELRSAAIDLPRAVQSRIGRVTQVHLHCDDPVISEPRVACEALKLQLTASRLPPVDLATSLDADVGSGRIALTGRGPTVGDATASFKFDGTLDDWQAGATLPALPLDALRDLAAPWIVVPPELMPKGTAALDVTASAIAGAVSARVQANLHALDYSNAAGTLVAEKVNAVVELEAGADLARPIGFRVNAAAGQMLAGSAFVDFGEHPAAFSGRVVVDDDTLQFSQLALRHIGLLGAGGEAVLTREPLAVRSADLDLRDVEFPAAWNSLLRIPLATTQFARLETSGRAQAHVRIDAGLPSAVDLVLERFAVRDALQKIEARGMDGELHWTAGQTGPPKPSRLAWQELSFSGLQSAAGRVEFSLQDRDFRLLNPARVPLWDGAVVVNQLDALGVGTPQFAGDFDTHIEPISLERITRTLGWTPFGGQVSGRIPGLSYRDRMLTLQGDLEAELFGGRMVARNLRIRDPLGATPQLYGDFTARDLDLEQLTQTFSFGTITGRLDGDLTGVETFGMTPVALDLRLATPENDKSRHRISQRAVRSLSSIGGGGSSVSAALQSGALRFFDTFRYDRIGLSCRLEDDVCTMNGVEPARNGYYIVKGSGLPRIDIIGSETRVDWPLLVSQVRTALANRDGIIVD